MAARSSLAARDGSVVFIQGASHSTALSGRLMVVCPAEEVTPGGPIPEAQVGPLQAGKEGGVGRPCQARHPSDQGCVCMNAHHADVLTSCKPKISCFHKFTFKSLKQQKQPSGRKRLWIM